MLMLLHCLSSYLIGFVEDRDPFVWHGYVLAVALFLLNIMRALSSQKLYYGKYLTGLHIRGSLTAAVYRKVIVGVIINLY